MRNRAWFILNIFSFYSIILSPEQSLSKPYSMTDRLCGRGFWILFQWIFTSRVATKDTQTCGKVAAWKTGSQKCHTGREFPSAKIWHLFFSACPHRTTLVRLYQPVSMQQALRWMETKVRILNGSLRIYQLLEKIITNNNGDITEFLRKT